MAVWLSAMMRHLLLATPIIGDKDAYEYGGANAEYNMGYYVGFVGGYRRKWSRDPERGNFIPLSGEEHPRENSVYVGTNLNQYFNEGYYLGYNSESPATHGLPKHW